MQHYGSITDGLRSFNLPANQFIDPNSLDRVNANFEELAIVAGTVHPDSGTFDIIGGTSDIVSREGNALRSLIANNIDEYTGVYPEGDGFAADEPWGEMPSMQSSTIRSQLEVEDLFHDAIQFLSCYGADADDSGSMLKLGLGPNFKPTINGTTPKAGWNNSKIGSAVNAFGSIFDTSSPNFNDPLSAIFGKHASPSSVFSSHNGLGSSNQYTEGSGDPLYGYSSDFGTPGNGKVGFGDFGGTGFGSGQGATGDPGFKDPSKFTFAGVSDNQSAFDRFMKKKDDQTSIGLSIGGGISPSGGGGGAVVSIDGVPSAFALVSLPGTLDPTGRAREAAKAIADKQAQQKFGFSNANPYGVSCPTPGFGISLSLP